MKQPLHLLRRLFYCMALLRFVLMKKLASHNMIPVPNSMPAGFSASATLPSRSITWLTASSDQCSGEAIAICCIPGGITSIGTHMPPMADKITTKQRSLNMRGIHSRNTVPEKNCAITSAQTGIQISSAWQAPSRNAGIQGAKQ